MECVVDNLGEPEAAVRFLGEVAAPGQRYVLEGRFAAALGRSDLLGLAVAVDDARATYLPAHVLEAPAVVAALAALVGLGGPPLVAHRAKELAHGLRRLPGASGQDGTAIDIRTLDLDTAVAAYLLDPAENTYELPDLARRYLQLDVAAGHRRSRRDPGPRRELRRRGSRPAGGGRLPPGRRPGGRAGGPGADGALPDGGTAAGAGADPDGRGRRARRPRLPPGAVGRADQGMR